MFLAPTHIGGPEGTFGGRPPCATVAGREKPTRLFENLNRRVRYRLASRSLTAPRKADPAYLSRFGGLWTDRRDAGEEIDLRLASGAITEDDAGRLRHWIEHGYVVLEDAVPQEACDRLRADLDQAFLHGDERLLFHSPAHAEYQPLRGRH